jgi:hypothetical protein
MIIIIIVIYLARNPDGLALFTESSFITQRDFRQQHGSEIGDLA